MTGESANHADPADDGLRASLLAHGIELARVGGPGAVSLREVQRRAGVSNSAAYRHYADRQALLTAIAEYASAQMARTMELAIGDAGRRAQGAADTARARLRATGWAYLDFARREPGLFRIAFLPELAFGNNADPPAPARGPGGLGPFQLLAGCIDELVAAGVMDPADRDYTDIAAWSAVHGLATLLLDGPLAQLDPAAQHRAIDRLLDIVSSGIFRVG